MDIILVLIPVSMVLGLIGLAGFLWALKNKQFDEDKANASRILHDDD